MVKPARLRSALAFLTDRLLPGVPGNVTGLCAGSAGYKNSPCLLCRTVHPAAVTASNRGFHSFRRAIAQSSARFVTCCHRLDAQVGKPVRLDHVIEVCEPGSGFVRRLGVGPGTRVPKEAS